MAMPSLRSLAAYALVTSFLLFFLGSGLSEHFSTSISSALDVSSSKNGKSGGRKQPDLSHYKDLRVLSKDEFPTENSKKRTIVLGDIHGMYDQLEDLLHKLSYDAKKDTIVSTGDMTAKGPLGGSLAVLRFMSTNNITAVRGNHDQKVVEWRSWIDWIASLPGGRRWLDAINEAFDNFDNSLSTKDRGKKDVVEEWASVQMASGGGFWDSIPRDFKIFQDHYWIATKMSKVEYEYLLQLPLRLYVPHAHTFIVHAGLLASDPSKDSRAAGQPLASLPILRRSPVETMSKQETKAMRQAQDLLLLSDVPQNTEPWVTLNMRSVLKNGKISREKDGKPWSKLWEHDMKSCGGYKPYKSRLLPCYPSTVVYGHAAARGLDVHRWTIGLDTGCVYQRRLSALVLGGRYATHISEDEATTFSDDMPDEEDDDYPEDMGAFDIKGHRQSSVVRFGDNLKGRIVSISCK